MSAGAFADLGLGRSLLRGINDAGFTEPRPIQQAALPAALARRDILGLAQTGTGKTAAFVLPILQQLIDHHAAEQPAPGPHALIVEPTRELAQQVATELNALAKHLPLRSVTIYGGVSPRPQVEGLRRRPHVIIACPGRLLDLMQQGHVDLRRVKTLVLDEADHMFDMGFLPDVRRILAALPAERQNMMFSATMPPDIRALADKLLNQPHVVELTSTTPVETIEHALCHTDEGGKMALLEALLRHDDFASAIVFTRTKHRAKRLALQLDKQGHRAAALQGNMSQAQRDRAMGGFRRKELNVLVATDIAARGIDVAKVSHVVNYDVPMTPEAYTHRIGRTGRSGEAGKAVTFVTQADRSLVRAIERRLGTPIPRQTIECSGMTIAPLAEQRPARPPRPAPRRDGFANRGNTSPRNRTEHDERPHAFARFQRRRPQRSSASQRPGPSS